MPVERPIRHGEAIREFATSDPSAVPDTLEGARHSACGGPAAGG
jgi:hypothetical protein